jgi:predicted transcriptional regulator
MRTTIRLDDELLRRAKRHAIETGRTLNAVIEDALRAALQRRRATPADRAELPSSGAGGTLPGVDLDNTAALYDVLDER